MAEVRFEGVHKLFGADAAVDDLNLSVGDGEFLVLVGPSGCGKTTTLRMLAGFERPTYGRIWIDDRMVNKVPPKERDIAMVFQSYALFPHMNVRQNLAFGTKVRREPKGDARLRVAEVADLLGLTPLLDRKPASLSGGQRQRVALGRALIRRPKVFLMDEPLSNLDAALRVQMRSELSHLHERFKVTTVHVTHDQVEAMTMGNRIAVMSEGRLQQVDTPDAIYETPANLFVAKFIGSPTMNLVGGRLTSTEGAPAVEFLGLTVPIKDEQLAASLSSGEVVVGIRPEDLVWDPAGSGSNTFGAVVDLVEPMGPEVFVTANAMNCQLTARFPPRCGVQPRETVQLQFDSNRLHLFDPSSGHSLLSPQMLSERMTAAGTLTASVAPVDGAR